MRLSKSPAVDYISLTIDKDRVKDFPSLSKTKQVKIKLDRSELERIKNFIKVVEEEENNSTKFERDPFDEAKAQKEYGMFSEFALEGLAETF